MFNMRKLSGAALVVTAITACSQAGQLGNILGSVLGGGANMVSGAIRGVDTRSQQISLEQSNGQAVALSYGYYVDSVVVTQSVNGSTTSGSANVQSLQGTVRQIDRTNGIFTLDAGGGVLLTVSMPYNANSSDVNRFNSLRSGDFVRFYGVYLTSTRVELRQFQ
jgi:hypothetical protein